MKKKVFKNIDGKEFSTNIPEIIVEAIEDLSEKLRLAKSNTIFGIPTIDASNNIVFTIIERDAKGEPWKLIQKIVI